MKQLKQIGLSLMLTVTIGLLVWMAAPSFWEDCVTSVTTGQQSVRYLQAAVNSNGTIYAVGCQDDVWRLVRGDARSRDANVTLEKLGITDIVSVSQLYACADDGVVLTAYEQKEELLCRAYYIAPDGKTARLLFSAPCASGSREDVRLSGFAGEGNTVSFLVEQDAGMAVYCFMSENESARKMTDLTAEEAETALYALPDGSAAFVDRNELVIGRDDIELPNEISPIDGWRTEDGACVLDGGAGVLWYIDTDTEEAEPLFTLTPSLIDMDVSPDGRVALLTDGGVLQVWRNGTVQDCTRMLYRQPWQSALLLGLGIAGVLLAALTLWYVLWELRRMQISLVVRYGAAVAVALVLLVTGAVRWVVQPHYEAQAETAAETWLRTAALTAPEPVVDPLGADWDLDEGLTTRAEYIYTLWRAFGSPQVPIRGSFDDIASDSPYLMAAEWALAYNITAGAGERRFGSEEELTAEQAFTFLYRAMRYIGGDRMTLVMENETLYRVEADGGKTLLSALLLGDAFYQAAADALQTGSAFVRYTDGGAAYYACLSAAGADRLTVLSTEVTPYLTMAREGAADTARLLWIAAGVVLALVLVALAVLSDSLRRVTEGMTAMRNGAYVEVVDRGGDEVSAMANSLNSMARAMREADAQELRRGDVYARFLPNRITDLLGVSSVETIDKQTAASRVLTTMHVSFLFDERIYESRAEELFDNINEVTECTARIVSAQGGVILSFSHDGFDALFAPDSSAPVSAAVAIRQEIISINRERSRRQLSPVTLRVTLDSGEVMLGVVGDEKRMQVTAVSSCFNTTRMLAALFDRFEANILCTERVERWTEGYGSRYIGKTHDGAELIRVYEIYDGDPYAVRQGKAESEKPFSEGVYTLYTGDYAAAKHIFMEIVRRGSGDGAARHYLYLADRFEKEPPEEVCLDC